jgi:hypothetical protein
MSPEHSISALTEDERRLVAAVEADLDRLLAVEPSADFAANVRARISAEQAARGWRLHWGFAAAAVLAIATGILVATLRDAPGGTAPAAITTSRDVALPAPKSPAPAVASNEPAGSVPIPPAQTPKPFFGSRIPDPGSRIDPSLAQAIEPEVLVPPEFRLAIERVLEMVRARTLDARAFSARTELPPGDPAERAAAVSGEFAEPVAPMVVEDLQVPPLDVAGNGVDKELRRY